MSENLSPAVAETSSAEDDDSKSKSKSKKKALGTFVVEAKPPKEAESIFEFKKSAENSADGETKLKGSEKSKKVEALKEKNEDGPETLDSFEQAEAVSRLAAARSQELSELDQENIDGESDLEAEAVAAYLAAAEADGDIDAAYEHAMSVVNTEAEASLTETDPLEVQESVINTDQPTEGEIPLRATPEDEDVDDTSVQTPVTAPSASASGGSNNSVPPTPPNSPGSASGIPPMGPNTPPSRPAIFNQSSTQLPSANRNVITAQQLTSAERRASNDGLLVGAIVGYLYGRRRGRIRTEKRLAPVQRKLEKQVEQLQTRLQATEYQVRAQARERALPAGGSTGEQTVEGTKRRTTRAERIQKTADVPEHIGHVLMAASATGESVNKSVNKTERVKVVKAEHTEARRRAESMSRDELLSLSEKVSVDGTNLRKIYETHLLSEKGLRRLVAEHLRGGNVARALKRELIERQIDFERDPILRDKSTRAAAETAGHAAVRAAISRDTKADSKSEGKSFTKPPKADRKKSSKVDTKPKPKATSAVDVALVTLIVVLAVAIVVLLLRG